MTLFHSYLTGLTVQSIVLGCVLAVAVVTDVSKQKVYNWLTFPAIALGFILNVSLQGFLPGLAFSAEGVAMASLSLILFLLKGAMGAGDVKMFWAVGALMGPHFTLWALICTAICGAFLGMGFAIAKGQFVHTWKNALLGGHVLAMTKNADSIKGMADASKVGKMPYAPAIAIGCAIAGYLIHKHTV